MNRLLMLLVFMSIAFATSGTVVSSESRTPQVTDSAQVYGSCGIELLTPTEGVDFNSYLPHVYREIKKRWFANLPASVAKGQKGINSVDFRILQNGSVPKAFLKIRAGSGKADLDEASLAGILEAAPFAKLPEKFTAPFIELRFTFYYNLEPPKPCRGG